MNGVQRKESAVGFGIAFGKFVDLFDDSAVCYCDDF